MLIIPSGDVYRRKPLSWGYESLWPFIEPGQRTRVRRHWERDGSLWAPVLYFAATYVNGDQATESGNTTNTLAVSATTGNALVGAVHWASGTVTLNSVSDGTNTYTLKDNPTDNGDGPYRAAHFYAYNITGGSLTIVCTFSGAVTSWAVVHQVSGIMTASDPYDGSIFNPQTNPGAGTDLLISTTITTSANGDYIFGSHADYSGTTVNAGTGFTARNGTLDRVSESLIQSTAGNIQTTFSPTDPFGAHLTGIVALKAAASGTSLTSSAGSLSVAGQALTFRVGSPLYLRYRK